MRSRLSRKRHRQNIKASVARGFELQLFLLNLDEEASGDGAQDVRLLTVVQELVASQVFLDPFKKQLHSQRIFRVVQFQWLDRVVGQKRKRLPVIGSLKRMRRRYAM
jgi:hypothetical protein